MSETRLPTFATVLSLFLAAPVLPAETTREHAPLDLPRLPAAVDDQDIAGVFWTNQEARECIEPLTLGFVAAFPGSLVPGPFEYPLEVTTYLLNLALKSCAAELSIPGTLRKDPDTGDAVSAGLRDLAGDPCYWEIDRPALSGVWENVVGIDLLGNFPSDWGAFGDPDVFHFNSQVSVELDPPGSIYPDDGSFLGDRIWRVPQGRNTAVWSAQTNLSILDLVFVPIPGPINVWTKKELALNVLKVVIQSSIGAFGDPFEPLDNPGTVNLGFQEVIVYDDLPPRVTLDPQTIFIEAESPGGSRRRDILSMLQDTVMVEEPCARPYSVSYRDIPEFLRVDRSYDVTWVVSDQGPRTSGGVNRVEEVQRIVIQDTRPPEIKAPPDLVVVSELSETEVAIGAPQVFDLVDVEPLIENDSPPGHVFPRGRTTVRWWATDQSGNRSPTVEQLVLVKESNRAPLADELTGPDSPSARTFEPTEVTLSGFDPDGDPIHMRIERNPENGFFVAPLFPYFIEDLRIETELDLDALRARCEPSGGVVPSGQFDFDYPLDADFVAVADDGTSYVIDQGWLRCDFGNLDSTGRIAVFGPDGALKRGGDGEPLAFRYEPRPKGIYVDQENEMVIVTDHTSGGTGTVLTYDLELNQTGRFRTDNADRIPEGENPLAFPTKSTIDFERQILYVTDGNVIRSFRADAVKAPDKPILLGSVFSGIGGNQIDDVVIDSAGAVYASLRFRDRILKFGPPTYPAPGGPFTPGPFVGWLGRCDFGDEEACDVENRRSIGFSCTDDTCGLDDPVGGSGGSGPGQFDEPRGMAVDPQDVLYVTDYENFRVQRFTTDGFYGGEARSACKGQCFVVGDWNKPEDVTVNSSRFFILDRETNLLHVSETTPITSISETEATVLYSSDAGFLGVDSFEYSASDGLARSAPARVDVRVERNFRPPTIGADQELTTAEDTPLPLTLLGEDPDGAADVLVYALVEGPESGSVTGGPGAARTYRPGADFTGNDAFRYTVSDGMFTSEPATVSIEVTPVNDPPFVPVPELPAAAGRGFPLVVTLEASDPDGGDLHSSRIDWGDGVVSPEDVLDEQRDGPQTVESGGGMVMVAARHVFERGGVSDVELCVSDRAGETACAEGSLQVSDLVDLELRSSVEEALVLANGARDSYRITVVNNRPQGWSGRAATGVVLTQGLPRGLRSASVRPSRGFCEQASGGLRCELGELAPGETVSVDFEIEATGSGDLVIEHEVAADVADALISSNRQSVLVQASGGGSANLCADGRALCLNDGRFRVEVDWRDFQGETGTGNVVDGGSNDSGLLYFFDPDNWELLVKVLDACSFSDRYWVLAAATTNIEYTLRVEDLATGQERVYTNPLGQSSAAIVDVEAFDSCGSGSRQRPNRAVGVRSGDELLERALRQMERIRLEGLGTASCGGEALCLDDDRFEVRVSWRDFEGNRGSGQVVPFGSNDSGLFYFFDPDNWELLVKVLDACSVSDRYWVFSAATTNVEYTLTITDTRTGATREYFNPLGRQAPAITDTGAFATCSQ